MWVFDGESWENDNGATDEVTRRRETDQKIRQADEFYPELQVIEIVPVPRLNHDIPPFPVPLP
jgi:hypothetical protein